MADLDRGLALRLAKGAGTTFIGKVFGSTFGFGSQLLLARLLGSRLFGLYALGYALFEFAELFAGLGLTAGAVRFASIHFGSRDYGRLKGVLQSSVGLPLLAGSVVAVALFFAADPLANGVFGKPDLCLVLRLFAFALPFSVAVRVAAAATTGFQTTKYFVFTQDILLQGANFGLIALMVGLGAGLPGAVIARGVASLIGAIVAVRLLALLYSRFVKDRVRPLFETKRLLSYSAPLVFGELAWLVLLWTDVLMVGAFLPAEELGGYRAASKTASILLLFLASINTIFAPIIADLHQRGDARRLAGVFRVATRWSFAATLPFFIVLLLLDEQLLLVFGPEFTIGTLSLGILATAQLLKSGSGGVDYLLMMSGHQYAKLIGDGLFAGVNVALNFLLIPRLGIAGAAWATAVSVVGLNLLRLLQVRALLGVQPYERAFLKPALAGIAAALAGLLSLQVVGSLHFLAQIGMTAPVVVLTYGTVLWTLGFEKADSLILERVMARLGVGDRGRGGDG